METSKERTGPAQKFLDGIWPQIFRFWAIETQKQGCSDLLKTAKISIGNLQRTSFHEDEFTMTFLSLANYVKYFFSLIIPLLFKYEQMKQYQLSSIADVLCGRPADDLTGWQSSCQGSEGQTPFPSEVFDVAF